MKKFGLTVPRELEGKVDEDLLKKTQAYEVEKTGFSFFSSGFGNIAVLVFIFGGLLNMYNAWIVSLNLSFIASGLLFFLLLSYVNTFISIPFGLYNTFKIEKKYGFNTMTWRLWLIDFLKSLGLSTVLTCILVSAGLWLVQASPDYWWIWVWCFFLAFSLFIMYISPYVIEPLFNKFTPVEAEGLEERIRALLQKVGIKVKRVFKMDASKRSRHTNAYFSGIGRVKRIILYDTLLEKMSHDEILAVLAHEAGHWKKRHVLKMIIAVEIISFNRYLSVFYDSPDGFSRRPFSHSACNLFRQHGRPRLYREYYFFPLYSFGQLCLKKIRKRIGQVCMQTDRKSGIYGKRLGRAFERQSFKPAPSSLICGVLLFSSPCCPEDKGYKEV